MSEQDKKLIIDSVLKIAKVVIYVLLSAIVSVPVQDALQTWLSVYVPDIYTLAIVNAIISSITKVIKEKVSEQSFLKAVL